MLPSRRSPGGGVLPAASLTLPAPGTGLTVQAPRPLPMAATFWSGEVTAPRLLPALPCLASPGAPRRGELDPQGVVLPPVDTPFTLLPLHLAPQPLLHTCVQRPQGPQFSPRGCLASWRLRLPASSAGGGSGNTSLAVSLCASLVLRAGGGGGGEEEDVTKCQHPLSTCLFSPRYHKSLISCILSSSILLRDCKPCLRMRRVRLRVVQ